MPSAYRTVVGIVLAGLAMSVGWGIRGDYGHEAGAMIPGALVGLAVCLASGREDWWDRAGVMGMAGAIGWAFGGQMSYGRVIGYTAASSLPDVLYGYASLFIIGGLWAGVGSAFLALSVTQSWSFLERFARPLVVLGLVWLVMSLTGLTAGLADRWSLNDTDWIGASSALLVAGACAAVIPSDRSACALIAVLAGGWWAGYLVLTGLLGLHMTPPRSDNWAGCLGLFAALVVYLRRKKDRAAVMAAGYGFGIGGLGFVLGDFLNMLGRAQWGPIGRYEALQGLDYWKWMEQSFGLVMGLGVGAVFLTGIRSGLPPANYDAPKSGLRTVALLLLLLVMMWSNLFKNARTWVSRNALPQDVLGVGARWWLLAVGVLLSASIMVAIVRRQRGSLALSPADAFGRAQLLLLIVLWVPVVGALTQAMPGMSGREVFLVHASFWLTAGICSLIILTFPPAQTLGTDLQPHSLASWPIGRAFWLCLCLVPLLLFAVACLTVASHDQPLPGSHLRFSGAGVPTGP
jgi:hypothetical protein